MGVVLPFGYIDQFAGVSFNTANILPSRCRLRTPSSSRVITLANGKAFNAGSSSLGAVWPVEQVLEIFIHGTTAGGGVAVDTVLQTVAAKINNEGTLRVRVPSGGRVYNATAVLDYIEIVNEGRMDDSDVINWTLAALHFFQMTEFVVG